jgi:hypothetical protein
MVNLASYQQIQRYDQMSFLQIWRFKNATKNVFRAYKACGDATVFHEWEAVALRIHTSLNAPQRMYEFFFDFVTLRVIKRAWLNSVVTEKLDKICLLTERKVLIDSGAAKIVKALERAFLEKLPSWTHEVSQEVLAEIQEYIKEKKALIEQSVDVALPQWYHATQSAHLFPIMNGSNLVQSLAGAQGPGVYFSTQDEHKYYGVYTFALDQRFLEMYDASYHQGALSTKDSMPCVWLCVKKDIKILWASVAHLTVDSCEAKEQLRSAMQCQLEEKVLPLATCPILTRQASDLIRKLVHQVCVYRFPEQWRASKTSGSLPLPYMLTETMLA